MKANLSRIREMVLALIFLAAHAGYSGDVSSITSIFQGADIPIGGHGVFQQNLSTTTPTWNATSVSFQSKFRFYSGFGTFGAFAQIFRPNANYSIGFQVNDPEQVGYRIKIHRHISGTSSIKWTGADGGTPAIASVRYHSGVTSVNGTNIGSLYSENFVERTASEQDPTPADAMHEVDMEALLTGYVGTQTFTVTDHEPAAQIVNVFQNYNTGSAELFFGMIPDGSNYINAPDDSGDWFTFTVIFNPTCVINRVNQNEASITFTGILQQSGNLKTWTDIEPHPVSPLQANLMGGPLFFRSRSVE